VLSGGRDRVLRGFDASPPGAPGVVPVMDVGAAVPLTAVAPPSWARGDARDAAAELVAAHQFRGGSVPPAAEGVGWGEGLVAQEVVAVCRFAFRIPLTAPLATNFVTVAYADASVRTMFGTDGSILAGGDDVSASQKGQVRYDGDEPVKLTAFQVWDFGEQLAAEGLFPHFLMGYSDGSLEIKYIGFLDDPVRLTAAETAFDERLAGGFGGGGGGGGGGGRGRKHRVTCIAPLGQAARDPATGRFVASFAVGFASEEGMGWYSVYHYYPFKRAA
jgi:hypothetical protein